ncbi:MAG: hypothetical protein ABR532_03090 [Candidatus Dormibacteria bacterium]
MFAAAKILIVGGILNLAVAFVLGYILSNSRLKDPARPQPYLLLSHKNALQESFMLLGLTWAVMLAKLPEGLMLTAAWLLVGSSVFQVGGSTVAWLQGTTDEFAERSPSFYIVTINAIMATIGVAILVYGVLNAVLTG